MPKIRLDVIPDIFILEMPLLDQSTPSQECEVTHAAVMTDT